MCESRIDLKERVKNMTDKEIAYELYGMINLAISLYRNDEGISPNEEYRRFHFYLRLLKKEASKRGISIKKSGLVAPLIANNKQ